MARTAGATKYVGFVRLRHLTPRPPEFRYPYPDPLQLLYVVNTTDEPVEGTNEPLVMRPRFVPLSQLDTLRLPEAERGLVTRILR